MARELADLRDMDLATLVDELRKSKQEALNLRFRHATGQLDNTAELGAVKKQIARINTLIRQQEIAAAESAGKCVSHDRNNNHICNNRRSSS